MKMLLLSLLMVSIWTASVYGPGLIGMRRKAD